MYGRIFSHSHPRVHFCTPKKHICTLTHNNFVFFEYEYRFGWVAGILTPEIIIA
jgi:hypothetical protein